MDKIKQWVGQELLRRRRENQPIMDMIKALAARANINPEDHRLYEAWQKGMPVDKVRDAGYLWLSRNPDDWCEANALVYDYIGLFGKHFSELSPKPQLKPPVERVVYGDFWVEFVKQRYRECSD